MRAIRPSHPASRRRAAVLVVVSSLVGVGAISVGIAAAASPKATPKDIGPIPVPSDFCLPLPLPLPLPGLCPTDSPSSTPTPSPSASPTVSPTVSPSATPTESATPSPTFTPTATPSATISLTPTASPTTTRPQAHPPLVTIQRVAATRNQPAKVVVTVIAQGSRITQITNVHLQHCTWNLGTAQAKAWTGGRNRLRIVISRKSQPTVGQARFRIFDAAGDRTNVSARV